MKATGGNFSANVEKKRQGDSNRENFIQDIFSFGRVRQLAFRKEQLFSQNCKTVSGGDAS